MTLAIHKSAIKRAKQNEIRNLGNKSNRTRVKNVIKQVRAAVDEKSAEQARAALATAVPDLLNDVFHPRTVCKNASRKISRLTKQFNIIAG